MLGSHHAARRRLEDPTEQAVQGAPYSPPATAPLVPARRILAFSSLMSTDMPHNDKEISQGVLLPKEES